MLNLTFLYETCDKTEIQFVQLCENKFCVYPRGHGTSFESGQPTHLCCLTRLYTVGCSNSYFDLDVPKIYNGLLEN